MIQGMDKLTSKGKTARLLFRKWVVDGVFGEVPRLVFGNGAGLRNNIGPMLHAAGTKVKGRPAVAYSGSSVPDAGPLKRDGYLLLDSPYDGQMFTELIRKFRQVIQDDHLTQPNGKYSVQVKDPLQTIPELVELLNASVRDLLHEFYGSSFRVIETQCFRNFPIPSWDRDLEAYSDYWHCDAYSASWLKVYILLSDWTEADGPTEIMPIRKTKKIMRAGYVNRYFSTFGKEGLALRTADADKAVGSLGSVFIFNPQRCLHRAGIPDDGHQRDAVVFFVAGSSAPKDGI